MKILAAGSGKTIMGEFIFKCKCGAVWAAESKEVKFIPPCLPDDVYRVSKCPCCNETRYISENEKDKKDGDAE